MDAVKQELFKRVAQMDALEVPHTQIATAIGLSPERVSQLLQAPEVIEIKMTLVAERLEKFSTLNDAWDMVEEQSVGHVLLALQAMELNPDPDFALKVAAMANKAQRRGTVHNRPIEGQAGARAVVHLHQHFVEQLENNHAVQMAPVNRPVTQKEESVLTPGDVQRLLASPGKQLTDELKNIFSGSLTPVEAVAG